MALTLDHQTSLFWVYVTFEEIPSKRSCYGRHWHWINVRSQWPWPLTSDHQHVSNTFLSHVNVCAKFEEVFWRCCTHKNGLGSWQMDDPQQNAFGCGFLRHKKRFFSLSKLHLRLSPNSLFFFIPLMLAPSFPQMLSCLFFNFSSICLSPSSIILFSPLDPLIPFTVCHTLYPPSP